jgi:hypothetical protein
VNAGEWASGGEGRLTQSSDELDLVAPAHDGMVLAPSSPVESLCGRRYHDSVNVIVRSNVEEVAWDAVSGNALPLRATKP